VERYELLCGGPLDGLAVPAVSVTICIPSREVLAQYPQAAGARYYRRGDGRLHFEHSGWDAAQGG
jgi:hypothetical protein